MNQTLPFHKGFFRALSASTSTVVVAVAMFCATEAHAGGLSYECEGLEEKSPLTSIAVKMYQGDDGWFFREGDLANMYELSPESISAFKKIDAALRYHGIRLILLPMLPRGIVGRQFIPHGGILSDMVYDASFSAQQFRSMIQSMRNEGLYAVDITEIEDQRRDFDWNQYYLKRDIHWTSEGARVVAKALADKIRGMHPANMNPIKFVTEQTRDVAVVHTNMAKALNELCQDKIPAEFVNVYNTTRSVDSLDALLADSDTGGRDLVHVVGTSFTDERLDFNFDGFLREFLGQDVSGFSVAGGGLTQSIYGWTQNSAGLAKRPEFLVWEYADLASVLQSTEYIQNAVAPAIVGDCTDSLKVAEREFGEAETFELDLPSLKGNGADHYLRYEFDNKALTRFELTYTYGDGSLKTATFENPSRVNGLTELYQGLPGGTESAPVRVSLKTGAGSASGAVKLCRYPDGIFQNMATSN